jgi:acyl-CoA synthetase (AMP-forming)/AMP-acid ligase II
MPDTLDDPQVFLPDLFESHGTYFPEREAVVCGPERRHWGEFNRNMNRVANALLAAGLRQGEKVAILMGNSVRMLEAMFGAVKAGACVVPLSGLLTGEQLARLLEDSDAVGAFATADFRARLEAAGLHPARLRPGLCIAADTAQGAAAGAAQGAAADPGAAAAAGQPRWRAFDAFVAAAPDTMPPARYAQGDPFNIIYSSGTTGLPKGIVQTHRARLHWAFSNAVEMGFTSRSRALTTTALYSNGTWLMMLPVLFAGGTLVAMPAFDPKGFLAAVQAERITHTFMVPAQYIGVLAEPTLAAHDTSSLQVMLCAGSPLRRDNKREVIRAFGDKLHELYGFSEGFATMLKPGAPESKFDTVGTPVLGFELRILDDAGRALPRGQTGEIAGYGAGLMKEYHKRPDATAELIWRDERGRTFVRSGDIGRLDADGYLTIVDRKKDMIISGGFNVFPTDLEAVVGGHPAVQDVTVIGVPHDKWGEAPIALVIRRPGDATDAEAIRAWANERLAKHQRLSAVVFRDDFPRNALGKVIKRVLREQMAGRPAGQ